MKIKTSIYILFIIILIISIPLLTFADNINKGQISAGYSYIDLDNEHLNFLPFLNIFWNYKNNNFEVYTSNEGYYLLNSIFNEKLNFNLNFYLNDINKLFINFNYENYNLPQLDSLSDSYNQFLLSFGYSNFDKNIITIKNETKYLLNINTQDEIYNTLYFDYIVPAINANYYSHLKLNYESDSNFTNIYTNIFFDLNGLFFVKNNQIFNLGLKGNGGYSFGKNQGNYFDVDYYNKISAILNSVFSYSTEFNFRYKYYINIVDPATEINVYSFSEKFSIFYSLDNFDFNISNKFNFYFFPDSTTSNYLEYILYVKIISVLSENFILNGESSADYSLYYLNSLNNSFLININLGILFDNKKNVSIEFNNKFDMNFENNNNFTTNETGFSVNYKVFKNFYAIGNLNYKITYNSSTKSGQQYFYIFIGMKYSF